MVSVPSLALLPLWETGKHAGCPWIPQALSLQPIGPLENPLPHAGSWRLPKEVPALTVRFTDCMKATTLIVVAIRHLQGHRNLVVLQIEIADYDLLNPRPFGLDLGAQFVRYALLRRIIGRQLPHRYSVHINRDRAGL